MKKKAPKFEWKKSALKHQGFSRGGIAGEMVTVPECAHRMDLTRVHTSGASWPALTLRIQFPTGAEAMRDELGKHLRALVDEFLTAAKL